METLEGKGRNLELSRGGVGRKMGVKSGTAQHPLRQLPSDLPPPWQQP